MKVTQLGIIFMLTFVECHHMKRLSKDSRLDECGLVCPCQNCQTSSENACLLHYWSSLNSGLSLGLTWDFSHLCFSCCSSLIQLVWHIVVTQCLRQVWTGRPTLEVSHSPQQSKGFYAANGVSCSRKHTLLCSGEHNNPLLKRMLHIIGYSIHCNCL